MKVLNSTRVKVLARKHRVADNGKIYYNIAIMSSGEAGNISCSKDVYDEVQEMQDYNLETEFNSEYGSFRATRVLQDLETKNPKDPLKP